MEAPFSISLSFPFFSFWGVLSIEPFCLFFFQGELFKEKKKVRGVFPRLETVPFFFAHDYIFQFWIPRCLKLTQDKEKIDQGERKKGLQGRGSNAQRRERRHRVGESRHFWSQGNNKERETEMQRDRKKGKLGDSKDSVSRQKSVLQVLWLLFG